MLTPALLARLAALDAAALCDAGPDVRVMDPGLRPVSSFRQMAGVARTASCRDDFLAVVRALNESQPGEVLVVDGGGGGRALAGELFATEAARRGLAGLVIDGACRDTPGLAALALPVYARRVCPAAGTSRNLGATQRAVVCGGVVVHPGDVVVGDPDGVIVLSEPELLSLLPRAEEIQRAEAAVLQRLAHGDTLLDMLNLTEHCEALRRGEPSSLSIRP
jgi:RraA family protein